MHKPIVVGIAGVILLAGIGVVAAVYRSQDKLPHEDKGRAFCTLFHVPPSQQIDNLRAGTSGVPSTFLVKATKAGIAENAPERLHASVEQYLRAVEAVGKDPHAVLTPRQQRGIDTLSVYVAQGCPA